MGSFQSVRTTRPRGGGIRRSPFGLGGLLALLVAGCVTEAAATGPADPDRLGQALFAANAQVVPAVGRRVTYDTGARTIRIVFTTPADFRIDYQDFWWRWRRNQAAVLAVFDQAEIAVEAVAVETNHTDGSGRVRVVSSPDVVRRHAARAAQAWLQSSEMFQQRAGTAEWEPVQHGD